MKYLKWGANQIFRILLGLTVMALVFWLFVGFELLVAVFRVFRIL